VAKAAAHPLQRESATRRQSGPRGRGVCCVRERRAIHGAGAADAAAAHAAAAGLRDPAARILDSVAWLRCGCRTSRHQDARIRSLTEGGRLTMAYVVTDEKPGNAVSIALLRSAARRLKSRPGWRAGFVPETSDRRRTMDVIWLDIDASRTQPAGHRRPGPPTEGGLPLECALARPPGRPGELPCRRQAATDAGHPRPRRGKGARGEVESVSLCVSAPA